MSNNTPGGSSDASSLVERLTKWMNSEGYPTEFRTTNIFRRHGFHARQGEYVEGKEDTKREIDVISSVSVDTDFGFLRISYVVECKWSSDKPWIIFTSPTNTMAVSAMAAQTISSKLGAATMWVIAGHKDLTSLETFAGQREEVLAVDNRSARAATTFIQLFRQRLLMRPHMYRGMTPQSVSGARCRTRVS